MTIRLYFDEDSMRRAIVNALRARGMDVRTALDAGMIDRADELHLEHASSEGRALFSFNVRDFYQLHSTLIREGKSHSGIIVARQQAYSVGELMRRILRLSAARTPEQMQDTIEFLSAWS